MAELQYLYLLFSIYSQLSTFYIQIYIECKDDLEKFFLVYSFNWSFKCVIVIINTLLLLNSPQQASWSSSRHTFKSVEEKGTC